MSNEKYVALANRLMKKTAEGTADWQTTPEEDVYALSTQHFTVLIGRRYNGDDYHVALTLQDFTGEVLDVAWAPELARATGNSPAFRTAMEALYDGARRKARGIDAALDSLLNDLGD